MWYVCIKMVNFDQRGIEMKWIKIWIQINGVIVIIVGVLGFFVMVPKPGFYLINKIALIGCCVFGALILKNAEKL